MVVHLALVSGDGSRREYTWEAGRSLAREMLAYLRDRLADQGGDFSTISGIGVFQGPGSYTGLRIGMTVLNTLASAQAIPIVGSSDEAWQAVCLERLAQGANDQVVLPEYGGDAHTTAPKK